MSERINAYKARKMAHDAGPMVLVVNDKRFDSLLKDIEETAKSGSFSLIASNDDGWLTVRHIVELHKLKFNLDLVESVYDRDSFGLEIRWDEQDD